MSLTLSLAFSLVGSVSISIHNPYVGEFLKQHAAEPLETVQQKYIEDDENSPMHDAIPTEEVLKFRTACIRKAEIGEQLALKKMHGTPLNVILESIVASHHDPKSQGRDLPWHVILEMQRIARDAYRENYASNYDIDAFVLDLYHHCLESGW